jgi:hypothetical protein
MTADREPSDRRPAAPAPGARPPGDERATTRDRHDAGQPGDAPVAGESDPSIERRHDVPTAGELTLASQPRGDAPDVGEPTFVDDTSENAAAPRGREPFDYGLPDHELPDRGLLERVWWFVSRWAVPIMMTGAYLLLAATSDTDAFARALMAAGLGLVMTVWFVFRSLAESAALARALSVGDVARLFALADRHLRHRRRPPSRARFLVARAFAHQLRGDHAAALAALDAAHPGPDLQPLAQTIRIGAFVELGRPASELGDLVVRSPRSPALARLAEGQLAWRAGNLDSAWQQLTRVIDDIRAGSATRAIAHVYAARIADSRGDATAAAHHRAAAAALAAPDAAWLRQT